MLKDMMINNATIEEIRQAIKDGADVNEKDNNGKTALILTSTNGEK